MSNRTAWSKNKGISRQISSSGVTEKLKASIYLLDADEYGPFLKEHVSEYTFPYKIYGMYDSLINRISKTYENTHENLGVLLNGLKGTGKSVTAERVCNDFINKGLPVIVITKNYSGLADYLSGIEQEVVVFIDEYEKIFKENKDPFHNNSATALLSIMDGALKSEYRRIFLLTTNELRVDQNLIQRPGRIRYVKTYKDLDKETIEEIVDDKLTITSWRKECINFISQLEHITVDIVKAVVDEVNIHDESPESFADVFNVKKIKNTFDVYEGKLSPSELFDKAPVQKAFDPGFDANQSELNGYEFYLKYYGTHFTINQKEGNSFLTQWYDHKNQEYKELWLTFKEAITYHSSFLF